MAPDTGSIACGVGLPLIVLLCGGDKGAQAKDIALALKLAKEV
jgi:putative component of toxin-antitoxin plasmid stabilization module